MSSPHGSPPPSNSVLTAFKSFVRCTPFVTRYAVAGIFLLYTVSWYSHYTPDIENSPLYTLLHIEFYRIILAPFVCTEIISLLFGSFSLYTSGKRLEHAIGSTAFLAILLTVGGLTHILHLILYVSVCLITGNHIWLLARSHGIWTILLGIIAMECSKAPSGYTRRFIFANVPMFYYPVALLAIFSLLRKSIVPAYLFSVLVGYAFGLDKVTFLQPSANRCSSWENNILNDFTQDPGWITGNAASGSSAWEMLPTYQSEGEWTPSLISQRNQQSLPQQPTQQTIVHRLSQRSNSRDAMLEAVERRAQQQQEKK